MSQVGVSHNKDVFTEKPVILTLEDKPILDDKGKLNMSGDTLHNAEIRNIEIAERNKRRKSKLSDVEDKYGDRLLPSSENILPQYNEPEADLSKPQFHLSSELTIESKNGTENQTLKEKVLNNLQNQREISRDYMSREEAEAKFGKKRQKLKLKRKRNKKNGEKGLNLISRGSRAANKAMSGNVTTKKVAVTDKTGEKLERYRSERREEEETKRAAEEKLKNVGSRIIDEDESEEDSLMLERILANQKKRNEEKIEEETKNNREEKQTALKELIKSEGYNETEDFLNALQTQSVLEKGKDSDVKREVLGTDVVKEEPTKLVKTEKEFKEPLVSSSVTDALKLFKMRGVLKGKDRHQYVGRVNDEGASFFKSEEKDPAPNIRLDYIDPVTGRPLTRKQAFRNISHIFHGQNPGDNKKAKLKRHMETFHNRRTEKSTETPTGLTRKFKRNAKEAEKPFIKLDQNRNAALIGLDEKYAKSKLKKIAKEKSDKFDI